MLTWKLAIASLGMSHDSWSSARKSRMYPTVLGLRAVGMKLCHVMNSKTMAFLSISSTVSPASEIQALSSLTKASRRCMTWASEGSRSAGTDA